MILKWKIVVLLPILTAVFIVASATMFAETIVFHEVSDPIKLEASKIWIPRFKELTGIDVKYVGAGIDQLIVMIAGGNAPDVSAQLNYVPRYREDKLALDLTPFINADKFDLSQFVQPVLYAPSLRGYRGEQLGIPYGASSFVLTYNKDAFDETGLSQYPPAKWDAPGWIWEDYWNCARKLTRDTNGDGKIDQWGSDLIAWLYGEWEHILFSYGKNLLNKDATEFIGHQPDVAEIYQRVIDMQDVAMPNTVVMGQLWKSGDPFVTGKCAMRNYWEGGMRFYKDMEFKWDTGVLPKGTVRTNMVSAVGVFILSSTKNPKAAWQLVKFLTTDPIALQSFSARANARVPVQREHTQWWLRNAPGTIFPPGTNLRPIVEGLPTSQVEMNLSHRLLGTPASDASKLVNDALAKAATRQISVAAAFAEIKPTIDNMLKKWHEGRK